MYILDTRSLSDICSVNIFFQYVTWCFIGRKSFHFSEIQFTSRNLILFLFSSYLKSFLFFFFNLSNGHKDFLSREIHNFNETYTNNHWALGTKHCSRSSEWPPWSKLSYPRDRWGRLNREKLNNLLKGTQLVRQRWGYMQMCNTMPLSFTTLLPP